MAGVDSANVARDLMLRSQLVGPVLSFVRARGGDADALRRALDLPDDAETAPEVRLPLRRLHALFDGAEVALGRTNFGLDLARGYRRGTWGILEFSSRSAPTLRDAFTRVARYTALFNESVIVSFEETGGVGTLSQRIPGRPECIGRHGNEHFAATLVIQASALVGRDVVPHRVFFAHRAPPDLADHRALFGGCPLEFAKHRNGVSFEAATLDAPVLSSDPPLLTLLDAMANAKLDERTKLGVTHDFAGQVREAIRAALAAGEKPAMAGVARALRVPARTFQRRLADEDATFAGLLDDVREDLARGYARDVSIPLAGIAYLLGYAELRPFVRAFKRWTKTSPGAFREGSLRAGKRR